MKYSLRQTSSHLHLAYRSQEGSEGLLGRHFWLEVQDRQLLLDIDLSANFHTRGSRAAHCHVAMNLERNHRQLRYVQCNDNLVRSRLIKAWERVERPQLQMTLDLGEHGRFAYAVQPHSLFMGGIQFDVQEVLDARGSATLAEPAVAGAADAEPARSLA